MSYKVTWTDIWGKEHEKEFTDFQDAQMYAFHRRFRDDIKQETLKLQGAPENAE